MLADTDVLSLICGGGLLKLILRRDRPHYAQQGSFYITNGDKYSFPSGHSFMAAALLVSIHPWAGPVPPLAGTALVCWARVAKGRHYPLDTVAGATLGFLVARVSRNSSVRWRLKLTIALMELGEILLATLRPQFQTPGYSAGSLLMALTWALLPFGRRNIPSPWSPRITKAAMLAGAVLLGVCPLLAIVEFDRTKKLSDAGGETPTDSSVDNAGRSTAQQMTSPLLLASSKLYLYRLLGSPTY